MRYLLAAALLTATLSAQETDQVTLVHVLQFHFPAAVAWEVKHDTQLPDSLIQWEHPTLDKPTPTELALLLDNPSAELLEAVRTGEFPQPPVEDGK